MKKTKLDQLSKIIEEGKSYTFENNREYSSYSSTYYSKASDELMAWVSKVENFINLNYSNESGPHKMMLSVKKEKLTDRYESEFNTEITKIKGAIKSCLEIEPNKRNVEHQIISLLINPYFWTSLVVISGAAYKFGHDNGSSRIYESNYFLNKQVDSLKTINQKLVKQINKNAMPKQNQK